MRSEDSFSELHYNISRVGKYPLKSGINENRLRAAAAFFSRRSPSHMRIVRVRGVIENDSSD